MTGMFTAPLGRPPNPTITTFQQNLTCPFPFDLRIPSITTLVGGYLMLAKINHGGELSTSKVAFYVNLTPEIFLFLHIALNCDSELCGI